MSAPPTNRDDRHATANHRGLRPGRGRRIRAAPPQTAAGQAHAARRGPGRAAAAIARRHWLITALLLAGLVLRGLSLAAYQPALLYIDSLKYLFGAWPGNDPLGYNVILKVLLIGGDLNTVTVIQHLRRPGHGRGLVPAPAAPRRTALAGRPGRRTGPARRLPGADRADHHAGRLVRGPDRRGPGVAAVAARAGALADRRGRPGPRRQRAHRPGRPDPDRARGDLPADHCPGLAAQAAPGGAPVRRVRPPHRRVLVPRVRGRPPVLARPRGGEHHSTGGWRRAPTARR